MLARTTCSLFACVVVLISAGCGEKDTTITPADMQAALKTVGKSYPVEYRMVPHYNDQIAVGTVKASKTAKPERFCIARQTATLPADCDGLIANGGWADVNLNDRYEGRNNPALRKLELALRPYAPDVE